MDLFEEQFAFIDAWIAGCARQGRLVVMDGCPSREWPAAGGRNLVIGQDIGVELGHPDDGSLALTLWGETQGGPPGGRIYRVGPDLPDAAGWRLPFAKVVMVRGRGFDADNTYRRYRRMEAVRYALDLQGYMMRAVSQVHREWSRVSREALDRGFSFGILGSALIRAYAALDFVDRVDVLFVTAGKEAIMALRPLADKVRQVTAAMTKMGEEMDFDCGSCSFAPVCSTVAGLRAMRQTLERKNA